MRGSVRVGIPVDATPGELRALASLLRAIERQRWDALAATFAKMARAGAELSDPLAAMVGAVAGGLSVEANHRDPEPTPAGAARGA